MRKISYLLLHDIPLLSSSGSEAAPDLLAHAHVLTGKSLKLLVVPVVRTLALHQSLMAFAASIGCLGREEVGLDLTPVEALHARTQELLVILRRPGS